MAVNKGAARPFWLAAITLLSSVFAVSAGKSPPAVTQLAKQFETHPLIMIGELHRSKEIHAFFQQLLRDPDFVCRADDIVVEFGNSRLQSIADAYVSGANITEAQLQSMWRETPVPLTWNSPVYRQFYETVRDINQKRLCNHPIRLVLADAPIDWTKVKTVKDFLPYSDRDTPYADVVEREVLAKHHRAFLVAGVAHVWKHMRKNEQEYDQPNVAELLERRHPGLLFCVMPVRSPGQAYVLHMGPPPSFKMVKGNKLERMDFGLITGGATETKISVNGKTVWKVTPDKYWPEMADVIDGVLYLGGNTSVYPSPTIYLDPAYQKELRRRATIIKAYSGQDFIPVIDDLVKEASKFKTTNAH